MNAAMRITITVALRNARALGQAAAGIQGVNNAAASGAAARAGFMSFFGSASLNRMSRWGKNLQWIGRQIEYNFTLPIVAAFALATSEQMKNEAAMTRLRKVYGDANEPRDHTREIQQLGQAYEILSGIFGVAQHQVIEIGAMWAAAGAEGVANARATRATLELMILGEMDAVAATEALITVMQGWDFTTTELRENIALLNLIENETAVTLADLVTVLQSSGGIAREAGLDFRHLGAITAALVPAATDAATAGTTVRSVIAQLGDPTNEVIRAFGTLGIQIDTLSWGALTFDQRLERMAEGYRGLTQNQRVQIATQLVGIRQGTRLLALLQDITSENSQYQRALDATAQGTGANSAAMRQYQDEIDLFLASSPQAAKILFTQLKNSASAIVAPMIPLFLRLLSYVNQAVRAFRDLAPATQQWILIGALALAAVGPIARYIGAWVLLFDTVSKGIRALLVGFRLLIVGLARLIFWFVSLATTIVTTVLGAIWSAVAAFFSLAASVATSIAAVIGWPALIAAAIVAGVAIVYFFRDEIGAAIDWIVEGITDRLPRAFINGMRSIINILATTVRAVIDWLSWLNPFARHSPSLVEQVTDGIDVIVAQYSRLDEATAVFVRAKQRLTDFTDATAAARARLQEQELAEQRRTVTEASPGAGGTFDALVESIREMQSLLPGLASDIAAQEAVVGQWETTLAKADARLDSANDELERLRDIATSAQEALSGAEQRLDDLVRTPIAGMGAMEQAIFDNEMAQKRLRLEMLRMGEEGGMSIEDIRQKLADLNADIEMLLAERNNLRLAGAGSDVLGPLDDAIAQLQARRGQLADAGSPLTELQDQLEELERQGQILDLERSLQFDPLTRQIEQLTNSVEEVPFDQLVAQIVAQQDEVARLRQEWEAANAAVAAQEQVVDAAQAHRDEIKEAADAARDHLDALTQTYRDLETAIRDAEAAISDLVSAQNAGTAGAGGGAGGGVEIPGDFPVAAGSGIGEETDITLDQLIEEWSAELQSMFGNLDFLSPVRDTWFRFKGWFEDQWSTFWTWVKAKKDEFVTRFGPINWWTLLAVPGWLIARTGLMQSIGGWVSSWLQVPSSMQPGADHLTNMFSRIYGWGEFAFGWLQDHAIPILGWLKDKFLELVDAVGPKLEEFRDVWEPLQESTGRVIGFVTWWLDFLLARIETVLVAIGAIMWFFWPALRNLIEVTWDFIVRTITSALDIIHGLILIVTGIINLDWQQVWNGIKYFFEGIWDGMYATVSFVIGLIAGVILGLRDRLEGPWNKLWEIISHAATWALDHVIKPAWEAVSGWFTDHVIHPFESVRDTIVGIFGDITDAAEGIFDGVRGAWRSALNLGRNVINAFIRGINIAGDLFGFHVDQIPEFASGGVIGGPRNGFQPMARGGVFNRATAIVGEGNGAYPEWVIPTDPRYRPRALDLFTTLARALGVSTMAAGGLPGVGRITGTLGDIGDAIGGAVSAVRERAIRAALAGPKALFDAAVDQMPNSPFMAMFAKETIRGLGDALYDWAVHYKTGSGILTQNQFAYLHKGEQVLNADEVRSRNSGNTYNFFGNLEFPNVRSGDDAKSFVENLDALV